MTFPDADGLRRPRRSGFASGPTGRARSPVFTILSVCTGNICRSPLAEQLFRSALEGEAGPAGGALFAFTSGGTQTRDGYAMDPLSAHFSAVHGGDPARHSSARLSGPLTSGADVMLTMTRQHLIDAAKGFPAVLLRGFTLREFARVLPFVAADLPRPNDADPAARLRSLVRLAAANRGRAPGGGDEDDIDDPIGRSEAVHERVAAEIAHAVDVVARELRAAAR